MLSQFAGDHCRRTKFFLLSIIFFYNQMNIYLGTYLKPELGTRSLFPGSLSALFISKDRYRSSAHLANFQVRSFLNRSQKNQWFALGKER